LTMGLKVSVVVDAGALGVTTDDPARLAPTKGAVGVELMPKDPLSHDHVSARRPGHERLGVVVDEGLVLSRHSSTPERILESLSSRSGHLVDGVRGT
jgi:hypothetical protein